MTNNNIEIIRGDDKVFVLTVTAKNTGLSVDITGCELTLTVRASPDGAILFAKTTDPAAGITLTDPTNGVAEIAIDAADTSSLTNTKQDYLFDVEIEKVSTLVETICKGKITVLPDITHA